MISLLLFGLIASAWAAPQYSYGRYSPYLDNPPPFFPDYNKLFYQPYRNGFFDTSRFWANISEGLGGIDDMLADFTSHFPTSVSREGIEGNEYKITIPLSGFAEEDIIVKARKGLLMIQASHNEGTQRNHLDIRTLPSTVNLNGTWIFEKSVLKIVFPLKEGEETVKSVAVMTTDFTTRRPTFDREEIDENRVDESEANGDADVGDDRGDQDKDRELMTHEIPDRNAVKATTHTVDLNDEAKFVPVRY